MIIGTDDPNRHHSKGQIFDVTAIAITPNHAPIIIGGNIPAVSIIGLTSKKGSYAGYEAFRTQAAIGEQFNADAAPTVYRHKKAAGETWAQGQPLFLVDNFVLSPTPTEAAGELALVWGFAFQDAASAATEGLAVTGRPYTWHTVPGA